MFLVVVAAMDLEEPHRLVFITIKKGPEITQGPIYAREVLT